eukprot:CAMPEP_0185194088 /NCGR_PEP_ID=MMETSP1140-20130426/29173_1 /TAXON_ID=298111 /ORGANISM="Pavlova sp., Strain CCMP459" /LENGTH=172 /DNA_ID=CAMNT_0027760977 /DNA_START=52 /DNA_END=570 /DNA_ORIENTATION=+
MVATDVVVREENDCEIFLSRVDDAVLLATHAVWTWQAERRSVNGDECSRDISSAPYPAYTGTVLAPLFNPEAWGLYLSGAAPGGSELLAIAHVEYERDFLSAESVHEMIIRFLSAKHSMRLLKIDVNPCVPTDVSRQVRVGCVAQVSRLASARGMRFGLKVDATDAIGGFVV